MAARADRMSGQEEIGYGKPPRVTRFRKGQSGNPRGRPKNRHREVPHDAVLGQMVTIREDGRERRVTAAEAFLLQLTRKGLAGDSAAARASLEAIERARAADTSHDDHVNAIIISFISSGADAILQPLGLAIKKYPKDKDRVHWELDPWGAASWLLLYESYHRLSYHFGASPCDASSNSMKFRAAFRSSSLSKLTSKSGAPPSMCRSAHNANFLPRSCSRPRST